MLRVGVVLSCCLVVAACGGHSSVDVTLGPATISPDVEDTSVLGHRAWILRAPVRVHARGCDEPIVATRQTFDGRYAGGSRPEPGDVVEISGYAGEVTDAHVTVRCGNRNGSATRSYRLPVLSCAGGPLPITQLQGAGTIEDDSRDGRQHRLRAGDLAGDFTVLRLWGTAVLDAPECNGFRVAFGGGTAGVGSYNAYGRGLPFSATHVVLTGDRHAGPVLVLGNVRASTLDAPCTPGCGVPPPSTVEVLSHGKTAIVRADAGAVDVDAVRLTAGHELEVRCEPGCTLGVPRSFLANQPLGAPPARPLARTQPGPARPPLAKLAPAYALITRAVSIPASSGEPAQVAVAWERSGRQGIVLWTLSGGRWQRSDTLEPRGPLEGLDVSAGDVTHDGHPDLIETLSTGGSAGCRDFRVLAEIAGKARVVFERGNICEAGGIEARNGDLVVSTIYGPCPQGRSGAHCYTGVRSQTLRWTANGFRRVG